MRIASVDLNLIDPRILHKLVFKRFFIVLDCLFYSGEREESFSQRKLEPLVNAIPYTKSVGECQHADSPAVKQFILALNSRRASGS